jgi:hypothetical protein
VTRYSTRQTRDRFVGDPHPANLSSPRSLQTELLLCNIQVLSTIARDRLPLRKEHVFFGGLFGDVVASFALTHAQQPN